MSLNEGSQQDEILTREEMNAGMRVTLLDGKMSGVITFIDDDGIGIHFDGTRRAMEYDWKDMPSLVREA